MYWNSHQIRDQGEQNPPFLLGNADITIASPSLAWRSSATRNAFTVVSPFHPLDWKLMSKEMRLKRIAQLERREHWLLARDGRITSEMYRVM